MGKRLKKVPGGQLLAVLIILESTFSLLWGLYPARKIDSYLIDQWDMAEGIHSNMIRSIKQTPDGYLWFATNKELLRFDGIKFTVISFAKKREDHPPPQTVPDTLFVDKKGILWIGSSSGLTQYNHNTVSFKTYTTANGITQDRIRHISEDRQGNLWITFYSSYVDCFSKEKFTHFDASHGLASNKINAVVEDRRGNLLFATRENRIFRYKDGKFYHYSELHLENYVIIAMYKDHKEDLWVGTNKGLFWLGDKNMEHYTTEDGLSDDYITAILEDSDHNLWIGTKKGINRLKKRHDGSVVSESVLEKFIIFSLFEDKEKSLWVGTYDSGIRRLKDRKFTSYAPLDAFAEDIFFSMFRDRQGDTWFGTNSGKLFHCRDNSLLEVITPPELSDIGITAIGEDSAGNLWLGTNGKGVFQKKNGTLVRFTTRQGLADNQVISIFKDSLDNLWFCTFNGVSILRHPNGSFESFTFGDGLSGKRAHNVYEDKDHNIWIAADSGITILKEGKTSKQNTRTLLGGVSVTCIYEDPSTTESEGPVYWIATHGFGFKRLVSNGSNITSYTTATGLATDFIYQFLDDQQGHFWLMSNSGLLRFDKNELNRFAFGSIDKINCTSLGVADGMTSSEFHSEFSRNSAFRGKDGELFFLTKKGISVLNPARIGPSHTAPPVVIEAIFFDRQPVPLSRDKDEAFHTFKGIRDFSFHFTSPSFLSPEKITFKYRLDGFEREWQFLLPGKERLVRYQELDPGTYTFKVTACNAEGVWSQNPTSFTFTLKPFFYQTLLFKIGALFLIIALSIVVLYTYKKHTAEKRRKYKSSNLNSHFARECEKKLKNLMEVEKAYMNPDISLRSLAEQLSIKPHILSQVMNERMNRNFYDFVNHYRIEEAKKILGNPDRSDLKVELLAVEVGFNTKAAFYNAFRKYAHKTPFQYKKEALKKIQENQEN
jgi:ligand-binding sensor domain-containing protein/AraC-like DNA-binding protein